ncbi:MAG TPA: hypothetical protein VLH94_04220 [Spirochaetia bacterium]|nr:hypothetical protein [Spirochaetia bacterium]
MNTSIDKNRLPQIAKIIVLGLLVVITASIVNRIFSSPFDFDESANLILSKVLQQTGSYSSYETVLDPIITTGPTVIFPVTFALSFNNVFVPRLVILVYSLLLIYIIFSKILQKTSAKALFLFLLCLTPYYFYFSSHVLGEVPALFLSLTGLYFLHNKKYFLSGLFLVLSIITKNIFLISLAPAIYLLYTQRNELSRQNLIRFVIPIILIIGSWEIYKLETLNFSLRSYYDNFYQLMRYNKSLTKAHPEYFLDRLDMLGGTFGVNGLLILFIMPVLSIYSFIKNKNYLIKSIALFVLVYLLYYFALGSTSWYRHFFPIFMLFIILLSDMASLIRLSKYSLIPIIIYFLTCLIFSTNNARYLSKQNLLPLYDQTGNKYLERADLLDQQLAAATYISSLEQKERVAGIGWYNAPEISFLANRQILKTPTDKDVSYLISHPFGYDFDDAITNYPDKETVIDTPLYKIYKKND